jgi:hypothetical protein
MLRRVIIEMPPFLCSASSAALAEPISPFLAVSGLAKA